MEQLEPRLLLSGAYGTKVDYATGKWPDSVISADFNGDGKADLAVANASGNTVSVLLGIGDGTFAAKVDYATGRYPISAISADFNGDGKADLAVANVSDNTVSILMGNGDGTFAAKVDYATGSYPLSVMPADFNGDGKTDLAVANRDDNTVSILLGNGDGTFAAKVDYATGASPYSVTAADFNGDGKADLAVANYNGNTVSILLGNGDGAFAAKVDYATGRSPLSVISADFNGDGKADLAVANIYDNTVSILLGSGDGTFAAKVDYATGTRPYSVMSTDFNGDGTADLVVTNYNAKTVSILRGNGDGTFAAKVDYTTGAGPYSVVSTDFNGDGKADLAVANIYDNTVSVLLHTSADVTPPSSSVVALPASTNSTTFIVNWSGSDDANGSSIAGYDIFVSDDGSAFTAWKTATLDTSAIYTGQPGHTYRFYSVATDTAGNREADPGQPDATISIGLSTSVDVTPPSSSVVALPASTNSTTFTVTWSGSDDANGSGIAGYDIFVSDNGGAFTAWKTATPDTSATYTGQPGHTYRFYSVATDTAGNREADPGQPEATISIWPTESKTLQGKDNKWKFTDSDGTSVTITYAGNGQAVVERWIDPTSPVHAGDIRSVTIDGSDVKGKLTITAKGKGTAAQTSIEDIIVYGSLKSITGKTTSLLGNVTVDGTLGSLTMDDATIGSTISVGPRPVGNTTSTTALTFDQVAEMSILSATPVKSLTVTQWLDNDGTADVISAPSIATLKVKGDKKRSLAGDFEADLNLQSQNSKGVSLNTFGAVGSVTGSTWTLAGGAGAISMGSTDAGWVASFGSEADGWANVKSITTKVGNLSGHIMANSIGSVSVKGSLANVTLDLKQAPDAKLQALGKLSAAGAVGGIWTLAGGAGAISMGSTDAGWVASFGSEADGWANVKSITTKVGNLSGHIMANSIGSVSVKGSLANATLDLKRGPDAKLQALGSLSVKGWIDSSQIRANGTIKTVTAGGIRDSSIFVGVNTVRDVDGVGGVSDNVLDLPGIGDLAVPPIGGLWAAIKALSVTGIKVGKTYVPSFVNSNIAAGSLGKMSLRYVMFDNDANPAAHDVPFGLTTATTSAFGLSYKDADRTHTYKWKNTDGSNLPSWFDDLALRLV